MNFELEVKTTSSNTAQTSLTRTLMWALGPADPTNLPLPVLPFQFGQTRMQIILTKCKNLGAPKFCIHTLWQMQKDYHKSIQHNMHYWATKPFIKINLCAKYLGVILDDSCISCIFSILHSYYLALLASWKYTILEFNHLANIPSWNLIILENYHLAKYPLG